MVRASGTPHISAFRPLPTCTEQLHTESLHKCGGTSHTHIIFPETPPRRQELNSRYLYLAALLLAFASQASSSLAI